VSWNTYLVHKKVVALLVKQRKKKTSSALSTPRVLSGSRDSNRLQGVVEPEGSEMYGIDFWKLPVKNFSCNGESGEGG